MARIGVAISTIAARTARNSMEGARGLREDGISTHLSDLNNLKHRHPSSGKRAFGGLLRKEERSRLIRQRAGRHNPSSQKRLYGSTGFPQAVQGKRGENHGESHGFISIFVFCNLPRFKLEQWVLGVWFTPKNVSSVPSLSRPRCCQMVQVRRGGMDPSNRVAHLKQREIGG
jgi:hypothetical protein